MELPKCRDYHPLSDLRSKPGYYPNISEKQLSAAKELTEKLRAIDIDIYDNNPNKVDNNVDDGEEPFLKLLRFLRARNFNVNKAFDMIKEDIKWRNKDEIRNIRYTKAETVLQCEFMHLFEYFPTW